MQVEGWKPFEDSPWQQAFRYGEVRYLVPATHIEFLQEVTPEEVRASTVHPCCTVTPVIEAVADFVRGRVRAAKETRAKREVEEAMRAAGIRR